MRSPRERVDDRSPRGLPSRQPHPRAAAKAAAARDVLGQALAGTIPLRRGLISAINGLLDTLSDVGREGERAA